MFRASITLVEIHAQVSRVAEGLLDRVLHAVVEDAAAEALHSFQQVKRFGMGGMLRVRHILVCQSSSDVEPMTGNARNRVHASNARTIRFPDSDQDAFRAVQQDIDGVCPTAWGREPAGTPRQCEEDIG